MTKMEWLRKFLKETDSLSLSSYMWELKKRTGCEVRSEGENLIFSGCNRKTGCNPNEIIDVLRKLVSF